METFLDWLAPVWAPHAGQREFLLAPDRTRVLACGRRWGKTEACAADVLNGLLGPPCRQLIVAPTLGQVRHLFDRVAGLLDRARKRLGLVGQPEVKSSPYPKIAWDGNVVLARSGYRPDSLRGDEADHIVVDEAAFVHPELINRALSPMLATRPGGRLTLLSTPNGFNGFWEQFERPGGWRRQAPSAENPQVRPDYLEEQRRALCADHFRAEYEAEFVSGDGAVFDEVLLDEASRGERPAEPPGPFAIGVDWAQRPDRTVVAVLSGTTERAWLWAMHALPHGLYRDLVSEVARILARYPDASVWADATGPGTMPTQMLRGEQNLVGLGLNAKTKPELVHGLVMAFERSALWIGDDRELREELRRFSRSVSPMGHPRYAAATGHDDRVIALALAVQALGESGPRILAG